MNLLHKAVRAFEHMSYGDRLVCILAVGYVLIWLISTLNRWWRRWWRRRRIHRAHERLKAAARAKQEGDREGHIAARYRLRDKWLEKIGYPGRKGRKSNQD